MFQSYSDYLDYQKTKSAKHLANMGGRLLSLASAGGQPLSLASAGGRLLFLVNAGGFS